MMTRVLKGGTLPAAEQGAALLTQRIQAIAAEGRLVQSVEVAADLVWASANAAALLFVTAQLRNAARPDPVVIDELRERTMQALLTPRKKAKAK